MTAPDAPRRWDRAGRWFARRGWAYLILMTGVALFLFPFVWMVGMSVKTDDEVVADRFLPELPTFRSAGPSVRPAVPIPLPPDGVSADRWPKLFGRLKDRAESMATTRPVPPGGQFVDAPALRASAAAALVGQVVLSLPAKTWDEPDDKVVEAFAGKLDPDTVDRAVTDRLARLQILGVEVRSLDNTITAIAVQPVVESGPAELYRIDAKTSYLRYHFKSGSDNPVVLRFEFESPCEAQDLHKLIVSYNPDDSWHRVDATLDIGSHRWESTQTTYVAQFRPATLSFQPPGFDDTTYQAKTWVPLKSIQGAWTDDPRKAVLRMTIRPSSTARALFGKVCRNYLRAFRAVPFWTYIGNSVLLVALQMFGSLFSASFVAYAFARLQWPGRSLAFGLLLATMMVPAQVTLIPGFVIWRTLGWYNTLNPLWVGSWFGSAFFIFLMTQFMRTIPKELEEAARIDGLNAVQTWWYVIVPLVKPTLAAIAIMVFMGAWNDFMGPLIMLRDQSKFPLSLGLFGLNVDQSKETTMLMAGNMLMTLPVIVIFFLFQRYFIEGVTVSGMKG